MTSTFGSLNIPLGALRSMQRAIEVTGHNVSNVETSGYSRQKALLTASDPYSVPSANRNQSVGQVGTGVTVEKIQRYRSDFLDSQIRQQSLIQKSWEVRQEVLQQMEVAFNEPSETGINQHLGEFWSAWSNLATSPDSTSARAQVAGTANSLSATLRETYGQLGTLQGELDDRVSMQVQQINDLSHRIAELNGTIRQVQGLGQQPNDLRDKRNKLLTELAGIIDIDAFENDTGSVTVNVGGKWLVSDQAVSELSTADDPANVQAGGGQMLKQVIWANTGTAVQINGITLEGGLSSLALERLGGELGGTLIARDLILPDKMGQLDEMTNTLIGAVNGVHQTGFDLNGSKGGGVTGMTPVANTIDDFSIAAPSSGQTGLTTGTYYVEVRDNSNELEFRLVDSTGQAVTIDDASTPGTTTTSNWQKFDLVDGTTFDTGRGLAIDFATLADHRLVGSVNTNTDVSNLSLSGIPQGTTELPNDTYYVEVHDNSGVSEFRLVDSGGNPVATYNNTAGDGSLTSNWQAIPGAPSSFDTRRGLTIQFSSGPYVEAVRGGSATPPPIPAANVTYEARQTQVGDWSSGAASVSLANFFSGTSAGDIALSDYISADYNRIATAAAANSPGDGSVALKLAQLQSAKLLNGGATTIGNFYQTTVTKLGQEAQQAGIMVDNHNLLVQHLQTRQEEVAGVSLDEEMVNLIAYQRTYQAAARVMTTVDEMLDKIINGMGVVGR